VTRESSEAFSPCTRRGSKKCFILTTATASILGVSVLIGGEAVIGDEVTLHPHAVILPRVQVGDGDLVATTPLATRLAPILLRLLSPWPKAMSRIPVGLGHKVEH